MDNKLLTTLLYSKEELEPETLYSLFPELSPLEIEKLMVIKVLLHTDFVNKDFDVFENAVYVINDIKPDVNKTEGVKPEWVWYALIFMNKLKALKLSQEVKAYIKWNFKDAGYSFLPDIGFTVEENPLITAVKEVAINGPFPLGEEFMSIQAMRYLKIQEYLKEKNK